MFARERPDAQETGLARGHDNERSAPFSATLFRRSPLFPGMLTPRELRPVSRHRVLSRGLLQQPAALRSTSPRLSGLLGDEPAPKSIRRRFPSATRRSCPLRPGPPRPSWHPTRRCTGSLSTQLHLRSRYRTVADIPHPRVAGNRGATRRGPTVRRSVWSADHTDRRTRRRLGTWDGRGRPASRRADLGAELGQRPPSDREPVTPGSTTKPPRYACIDRSSSGRLGRRRRGRQTGR
jgi:hypothetical protein